MSLRRLIEGSLILPLNAQCIIMIEWAFVVPPLPLVCEREHFWYPSSTDHTILDQSLQGSIWERNEHVIKYTKNILIYLYIFPLENFTFLTIEELLLFRASLSPFHGVFNPFSSFSDSLLPSLCINAQLLPQHNSKYNTWELFIYEKWYKRRPWVFFFAAPIEI